MGTTIFIPSEQVFYAARCGSKLYIRLHIRSIIFNSVVASDVFLAGMQNLSIMAHSGSGGFPLLLAADESHSALRKRDKLRHLIKWCCSRKG